MPARRAVAAGPKRCNLSGAVQLIDSIAHLPQHESGRCHGSIEIDGKPQLRTEVVEI